MTSEEAIAKILNEQVSGYKELLELLRQERLCLIDLNADCVEELSKKKDTLAMKLRLLEEECLRIMKGFGSGMTLQDLAEVTGKSTFLDIRSRRRSLMQAIEELNNFNRLLIEQSLSYFRRSVGFFTTFGMQGNLSQKGLLISRET